MKRGIVVLALLGLVCPGGIAAREEAASPHDQAVLELFRVMGLERTMMGGATAMIDAQIETNPAIAPFRDVMLEWAGKFLTWNAVVPELSAIYKEAFTERELREMVTFYRTPTGEKTLVKLPELMQKGASIGAALAQRHLSDLEKMVLDRKKELESAEQKP